VKSEGLARRSSTTRSATRSVSSAMKDRAMEPLQLRWNSANFSLLA
jgi:hypothetical protein